MKISQNHFLYPLKEEFDFVQSKVDPGVKEIYTTYLDNALSVNVPDDCANEIIPCNHEEVDTRILLHAAHAAKNGQQKGSICTVDTDVVALSVAYILHLQISRALD